MFENYSFPKLTINKKEYPYWCDLSVLEQIQEEIGDLVVAENMIRGFVPKVDKDGVVDLSEGKTVIPNINFICKVLVWMMEEAREIIKDDSGEEIEILTEKDLKRQSDYNVLELSALTFYEFESGINGKKKWKKEPKSTRKKTATKTQNTKQ